MRGTFVSFPIELLLLKGCLLAALVATTACSERKAPPPLPGSPAAATVTTAAPALPAAGLPLQAAAEVADGAPTVRCTPAWTAEQCAAANASLARDGAALAAEMEAAAKVPSTKPSADEAGRPDAAALAQQECALQRAQLAALQRMRNPPPGEIVAPEEAAALPGLIARTEAAVAKSCP